MKLVDDGRDEHFLKEGEVQNIHNVFSLNKPTDGAINIVTLEMAIQFKPV
jgi:hypothetical protein